ncbi:MAG: ATP-grasp domain-containing protein [Bacteroidota bacterium]
MHVALTHNLKREDAGEDGSNGSSKRPLLDIRSDVTLTGSAPQVKKPPLIDTFAEWDSVETITAVKSALERHHTVSLVEADRFAFEKLATLKPDFAFNMAEGWGGPSREAQIPVLLELLEIPYTGSDPLTLCICLDKSRTKEILLAHGISTPSFTVVSVKDELDDVHLNYPLIVKPLYEGSSKGVFDSSVVRTPQQLETESLRVMRSYGQPALIEEFLPGREFTVALLGNGKHVRVLPIIESKFDHLPSHASPINSFEAKWVWDTIDRPMDVLECPAKISSTLQREIENLCRQVFSILRCRDWCRIDLRLDAGGGPNILEVNPIPGVLPNPEEHSFFPTAAAAAGLSYDDMINEVVSAALARYNRFPIQ